MANVCNNAVTITGPYHIMNRFYFLRERYLSSFLSGKHGMNQLLPPLSFFDNDDYETKGIYPEFMAQYMRHVSNIDIDYIFDANVFGSQETVSKCIIYFESNWEGPSVFMAELSKAIPELEITLRSAESGCQNAEEYYYHGADPDNGYSHSDRCSIYDIDKSEIAAAIDNESASEYETSEIWEETRYGLMNDAEYDFLREDVSEFHTEHSIDFSSREGWGVIDYVLAGEADELGAFIRDNGIDWTESKYFLGGLNPLFVAILARNLSTDAQDKVIQTLLDTTDVTKIHLLDDQRGNNLLHYVIGSLSYSNPELAEEVVENLKNEHKHLYEGMMMSCNYCGLLPALYDTSLLSVYSDGDTCFGGELGRELSEMVTSGKVVLKDSLLPYMLLTMSDSELDLFSIDHQAFIKSFNKLYDDYNKRVKDIKFAEQAETLYSYIGLYVSSVIGDVLWATKEKNEISDKVTKLLAGRLSSIINLMSSEISPLPDSSRSANSKSGVFDIVNIYKTMKNSSYYTNEDAAKLLISFLSHITKNGMWFDMYHDTIGKENGKEKTFSEMLDDSGLLQRCESVINYNMLPDDLKDGGQMSATPSVRI